MKTQIQHISEIGVAEIQTLSKPKTLLKCSIFLFILSIGMCLLAEGDLNSILNSIRLF